MNHEADFYTDPLIDEVRGRRRALFADCGNDLRELGKVIQRRQEAHPEKLVDRRLDIGLLRINGRSTSVG